MEELQDWTLEGYLLAVISFLVWSASNKLKTSKALAYNIQLHF